jgi:hypothetical protein
MTTLIGLFIGLWVGKTLLRAYQQAEVRKVNPEAWVRLQELELEKRVMRRQTMKNATGLGLTIARLLSGK